MAAKKSTPITGLLILGCFMLVAGAAWANPGPFDGKTFKGRIAYSADGNYNDPDDWSASPVALAIFAQCGLRDKLVHFDYNCILPKSNPKMEQEHARSVLGAAKLYGYPETVFQDCQKDLKGAVQSIKRAIDASSAEDPLYFILAGPMEVPALGIAASDPAKRQFVYCISHNAWNDGYASGDLVKHNKRDVIPLGIKWVQIADQNPLLMTSPYGRPARPEEFSAFFWMRDSADAKNRFQWERLAASTRPDCSDAGMGWFLVTGDEKCDILKLKSLMEDKKIPQPVGTRTHIRMEAENFRTLEDGEVIFYKKDRSISQRIYVGFKGKGAGRMETVFDEPYTAQREHYHVWVRCSGGKTGAAQFRLFVGGKPQGSAWEATGEAWQVQKIQGVELATGDTIAIECKGHAGEYGRVDYVELSKASIKGPQGRKGPKGQKEKSEKEGARAGANVPRPVAPGKFIPSFAIKYGSSQGWPALEDAAKYDLIVGGAGAARSKAHATIPGNQWEVVKKINPGLLIFMYQIGPAEYNTAEWGELGKGWEWIKANHGKGSADPWIAVGEKYGDYLQSAPYPNERMMLPGKPAWQQFWLDGIYDKIWDDPTKPSAIADGVFSDNTRYVIIWQGNWRREKHPDQPDEAADYMVDGKMDLKRYHDEMKSFFNRGFPWLRERGKLIALNFGNSARDPEALMELDSEPDPPFAAMEEGAFAHPWGTLGKKGNFVFYPEKEWLNQVEAMRRLKHVRSLMTVHGPVVSQAQDFTRMEASDASGRRAWDVLWYAMMSFLQGYDDVRQNAYLNFTLWGYSKFYWFGEFDPAKLHLGWAKGEYRKAEGRKGHVYLREFEDGWAVVNPSDQAVEGVAVPAGEARVIDHDALAKPEARELVKQFDLPARRGVVLLKPGRAIGNSDN